MRFRLIQHLLEYGALAFDNDHRVAVTDYVLLEEGLALLGIKSSEELIAYLQQGEAMKEVE